MKIITKHNQIKTAPKQMQAHLYAEFAKIHGLYDDNVQLADFDLAEIGEFAILQNNADSFDLSQLNYKGSLIEQSIEFVYKYTNFYDVYVLHDTDSGTRFLIPTNILDEETKAILERNLNNDYRKSND